MFLQIFKKLIKGKVAKSGRNNQGKITVRHRSGGVFKRKIRLIDYFRYYHNIPAIILIPKLYSPRLTTYLSLILYKNGVFTFIIKPRFLEKGDFITFSSKTVIPKVGNSCPLRIVPEGLFLNSICLNKLNKSIFAKAAGTHIFIINKFVTIGNKVLIRLPSSEEYLIEGNNLCNLGRIDNIDHLTKRYYKAGQLRHIGKRPYVRGVAMNAIDHPHGGNTSIGRQPVNIWATCYAKGGKTRKKEINKYFIFHRRK